MHSEGPDTPQAEPTPWSSPDHPSHASLERARVRANAQRELFELAGENPRIGRFHVLERIGAGGIGVVYGAYDPQLDRRVALKLVVPYTEGDRVEVLAEARALARIAHPNVVPVHDVGVIDKYVYIVMEYVEGPTFRALMRTSHPTADNTVLARYEQAGRGLEAVHAAGLVHRDFKPENVICGRDGRVRIVDFGLARAAPGASGFRADEAGPACAGTPAYMAPEQVGGAAARASSDQYAFCVALCEALTGRRPTIHDVRSDAVAGVDPTIAGVLRRGLADDPQDRFESMSALLQALEQRSGRTRRPWRVYLLGAGVATLAVVGFAALVAEDDACASDDSALAELWSPAEREGQWAHLRRASDGDAETALARVDAAIESFSHDWAQAQQVACVEREAGVGPTRWGQRRAACLARALGQWSALSTVVGDGDATGEGLSRLVMAASLLEDPASCWARVDPAAGTERARLEATQAVQSALARAELAWIAGRHDRAGMAIDDALALAQAADDDEASLAHVWLAQGRLALVAGRREGALAPLARATAVAFRHGDHVVALEGWARHAWAVGSSQSSPQQGLAELRWAQSMVAGLPEGGADLDFVRALLLNNLGSLRLAAGARAKAREAFSAAIAIATDAASEAGLSPAQSMELAQARFNLALVVDDAQRDRLFAGLRSEFSLRLGPRHPWILDLEARAAKLTRDPQRARARLRELCSQLSEHHPGLARRLAQCRYEWAWALGLGGEQAQASAVMGLVGQSRHAAPERRMIARAMAASEASELEAAQRELAEHFGASFEQTSDFQVLIAGEAAFARGRALASLGRHPAARSSLEVAINRLGAFADKVPLAPATRRLDWARKELERLQSRGVITSVRR